VFTHTAHSSQAWSASKQLRISVVCVRVCVRVCVCVRMCVCVWRGDGREGQLLCGWRRTQAVSDQTISVCSGCWTFHLTCCTI